MTDLAMTFPEIPLADIEARAQKLLDDYEGHVGLRIQAPIPVENIAEHYLGEHIEITNERLFEDPRPSAVSSPMKRDSRECLGGITRGSIQLHDRA